MTARVRCSTTPRRSHRVWSHRQSLRSPTRIGSRCARWCRVGRSTRSWTIWRPSEPRRSWPRTFGSVGSDLECAGAAGFAVLASRLEPRSVVEPLRRVAVTHFYVLLLALGIGVVAGLRSMTAPAVVAWAAVLHWINLNGTWASWLGHPVTVAIITVLAVAELAG